MKTIISALVAISFFGTSAALASQEPLNGAVRGDAISSETFMDTVLIGYKKSS